jgi:transmembrane sensor
MRNIEKLLTDEEFIKWVKNPTAENDLFWREWIKGNPDRLNDVNIARNLIQQFNYNKAPEDDERFNRVLKNILLEKTLENQKQHSPNKNFATIGFDAWIKVAAVIIFLLTFAFIIRINFSKADVEAPLVNVTKQNPNGQKSTILLPDSTVVVLNSGSSINYPEKFIGKYRDIELTGEAYFEVSENKQCPFRVKTGDLITTALGTSFNVRAFDTESKISVSLNTGKVAINNAKDQFDESLILNPGEKAVYNLAIQKVTKHKYDKELELSWKDGILVFKQTNLKDFIHTIERWYGVTVDLSGNVEVDCSINGRFENEILEVVLESLEYSREVDYKLDNKKVRLKIKA